MRSAAVFLAALLGTLGLVAVAPLAPPVPLAATCAAAGSHHASVVVEHESTVIRRCVGFSGDSISGEQLLRLSGIEFRTQTFGGFGDAICQVDNTPPQYTDCLGKDNYWAYFVERRGRSWQYSSIGITNVALHDGDAEGFRYLPTGAALAAPPAPGVCPPPAAPTATPVVTPRPTIVRTQTPGSSVHPTEPPVSAVLSPSPPVQSSPGEHSTVGPPAVAPSTAEPSSPGPTAAGETSTTSSSGPDGGVVMAGAAGVALVALMAVRAIGRRRGRRP